MPFFFPDEKETIQIAIGTRRFANLNFSLFAQTHNPLPTGRQALTKNSGSHQIAFAIAPAWARPEPAHQNSLARLFKQTVYTQS